MLKLTQVSTTQVNGTVVSGGWVLSDGKGGFTTFDHEPSNRELGVACFNMSPRGHKVQLGKGVGNTTLSYCQHGADRQPTCSWCQVLSGKSDPLWDGPHTNPKLDFSPWALSYSDRLLNNHPGESWETIMAGQQELINAANTLLEM